MRILLVNDAAGLREGMKELLLKSYSDLTVDEAEDGNEALQLYAERGPYDVVLTDIKHPGPNGIELAESIRKQEPRQQIGFITEYWFPKKLFDSILNLVFDGSDLIEFVDKLRAESSELRDTCFDLESMRKWG